MSLFFHARKQYHLDPFLIPLAFGTATCAYLIIIAYFTYLLALSLAVAYVPSSYHWQTCSSLQRAYNCQVLVYAFRCSLL